MSAGATSEESSQRPQMPSVSPVAYLILRHDGRWSDVFRLVPDQPLVIGRSSKNAIVIADERSSRRHAEIYFEHSSWYVRDLGSRNGTLVEGRPISEAFRLDSGQTIQVAGVAMTFVDSLLEVGAKKSLTSSLSGGENESPLRDSHSIAQTAEIDLPPTILKSSTVPDWIAKTAFELSTQPNFQSACDAVLDILLKQFHIHAGAVIAIEASIAPSEVHAVKVHAVKTVKVDHRSANSPKSNPTVVETPLRMSIISARERPGKGYRRLNDFLARHVLEHRQAILARNIQNDPIFSALGQTLVLSSHPGNSGTSATNTKHLISESQTLSTQSVLCAPISIASSTATLENDAKDSDAIFLGSKPLSTEIAILHLYAREDEPELQQDALELGIAAAQILGVAYRQFEQRKQIEEKLQLAEKQVVALKSQLHDQGSEYAIIGNSRSIIRLKEQLRRVAVTPSTVLLRGASGVGKELAAREIHAQSNVANGPFIAINCGALSPMLLESELFGHEKGAFTGATEKKAGKFELADGGTIFLDEVGEMTPEVQIKFLRALENRSFERVGGSKTVNVNVRVIAATNRDLEEAVAQRQFRSDLYYRLRVVELLVPSLVDRREDILLLARHFLDRFRKRSTTGPVGFSGSAEQAMLQYDWPGNIRELRNAVERAHVLSNHQFAEVDDLGLRYAQKSRQSEDSNISATAGYPAGGEQPEQASRMQNDVSSAVDSLRTNPPNPAEINPSAFDPPQGSFEEPQVDRSQYHQRSLEEIEREHILSTLRFTNGQKSRAATILGIERSTLDRKLKRYEEET